MPRLLGWGLVIVSAIRVLGVLDLIQWPAMAVTVLASWYLASPHSRRRIWGLCLAAVNIRGERKTRQSRADTGTRLLKATDDEDVHHEAQIEHGQQLETRKTELMRESEGEGESAVRRSGADEAPARA